MTRPLRIEFPGALYHVTTRGNRLSTIYVDDVDRQAWLYLLAEVCFRFNFVVAAYCQMGNHYHLMVETPDGNLCQGMRQLNSVYSQQFNRRHRQVGHVLQGRYKAILVQRESYLLELARYIVLNPVRANCVQLAEDWEWSSYRSTAGKEHPPAWLDCDWLLEQFGTNRLEACAAYEKFIADGVGAPNPMEAAQFQLLLGDQDFVDRCLAAPVSNELTAVCRQQRRITALTLQEYAAAFTDRDRAMAAAYFSTAFTMVEIGAQFRVSSQTVSRAVKRYKNL